MKNILLGLLCTILAISCTDQDDKKIVTEVTGGWQLIEQLSDPGNGSGVFVPVTSDKRITFNFDGSVSCNGPLCFMSVETGTSSTASLSIATQTITPLNCNNGDYTISYELNGDILILNYPCIEACAQKYERLY